MDLPTSPKRCLAIAMLRVVGLKQKNTARITECANQTVVNVEKWFKKEDYHKVIRICDDQIIKKMVATEAIYWGLEAETLVRLDRLTQDDILRHYRTDYIEQQDPILQKYFMEWREQLNHPPPERIYIERLGRVGEPNSASLGQSIVDIALENVRFDVRVTQTTLHPDYAYTSDKIYWELPLDGPPKLRCPVERQPRFEELLAKLTPEGRQSFSSWKSLGGELIVGCMHALKTVRGVAQARAGQLLGLVGADSVFEKIRSNLRLPKGFRSPSYLTPEFADLIYPLSIKCGRSPSTLQVIERLYHIRERGPLHYDLIFGQERNSLVTGLSFEIEQCIHLNQLLIKEFAQSKMVSQLIEMDARLLTPEKVVKAELTKIIDKGVLD